MAIGLDQIKRWGEQICALPAAATAAEAVAALGVPADAVIDTGEHQGAFSRVAVRVEASRAELDRALGARNDLPRVGAGRPYQAQYAIRVPGAPFTCAVTAKIPRFDEMPNDASAVTEVTLRRDRAPS